MRGAAKIGVVVLLAGCAQTSDTVRTVGSSAPSFDPRQVGKSDIDRVADALAAGEAASATAAAAAAAGAAAEFARAASSFSSGTSKNENVDTGPPSTGAVPSA